MAWTLDSVEEKGGVNDNHLLNLIRTVAQALKLGEGIFHSGQWAPNRPEAGHCFSQRLILQDFELTYGEPVHDPPAVTAAAPSTSAVDTQCGSKQVWS